MCIRETADQALGGVIKAAICENIDPWARIQFVYIHYTKMQKELGSEIQQIQIIIENFSRMRYTKISGPSGPGNKRKRYTNDRIRTDQIRSARLAEQAQRGR